jgi:hypothetical protein
MTTQWTLAIDCADPAGLAEFWALALGCQPSPPPAGFGSWEQWLVRYEVPEEEWNDGASRSDPVGRLPRLSFLKVPEAKVAKNRPHLDVQVGGGRDTVPWEQRWPRVLAELEKLVAAGATVLATVEELGQPDHVVLADPEGNEFCLL